MAVQGLAAALAAASAYLRAQLPPEVMRLVSAGYSALPAGTSTVLSTTFAGLVATLAVLLLRPGVLRAGVRNVLPFFAVAGSTLLAVLVPLAIGGAITVLGLLSFGPMIAAYVAGRWLLLSFTTRVVLAAIPPLAVVVFTAALYQVGRRQGHGRAERRSVWQVLWQGTLSLRIYLSFLLPFYTPFAILIVGAFSLVWAASIGAFMFIQGEVFADWSGGARRRWPGMIALCETLFAGAVFDYFPISVRRGATALRLATGEEASLRPERRYLFCYHPHGVYAFGLFALLFGSRSRFHALFQHGAPAAAGGGEAEGAGERAGRRRRAASASPSRSPAGLGGRGGEEQRGMLLGVANALLHVPLVSTFFGWFGFIPVAPKCLAEACASEHNVALVPGGIAEMTAFEGPHVEVIVLKRRLGFVRLALQHGRDLVPVYSFGESRTFHQYTCARRMRTRLARRTRLALHLFRGRAFTLIPFARPICVVVGAPIPVPVPVPEPSEEQVGRASLPFCASIFLRS